jgi:uncharacterized membrane protein YozB (DUF420 family)
VSESEDLCPAKFFGGRKKFVAAAMALWFAALPLGVALYVFLYWLVLLG